MLAARYGRGVSGEEFAELLSADRARYFCGDIASPILVPSLGLADGGTDDGCMTRSDWAVKMRLSGSDIEAARTVAMVRWMCDQLDIAKEEGSSTLDLLEKQIRVMAQMIPDDVLEEYEAEIPQECCSMQFEILRNAAEDYSSDLRRRNRGLVESAIFRLSRLPEETVLFGIEAPPRGGLEEN